VSLANFFSPKTKICSSLKDVFLENIKAYALHEKKVFSKFAPSPIHITHTHTYSFLQTISIVLPVLFVFFYFVWTMRKRVVHPFEANQNLYRYICGFLNILEVRKKESKHWIKLTTESFTIIHCSQEKKLTCAYFLASHLGDTMSTDYQYVFH